ncbi:hypothetical protein ACL6C3_25595 [Capilliphycus salinus ALCB114379]|uniref:hypothetical protein n=1 Tax=Capilliphycus salinus TaxID=2768948 RepID=UPI0039A582C0
MTKIVFDTSYRVQPGDTVKSIAEKGFKDGDRWREVRLENGTHFTSLDSSQLLAGQRVYLPIKIGERVHPPSAYGQGDDFLSTDDLMPLSPIYSNFYQGLIRFSPASLLLKRPIVQPLIEHFLEGKGGVYQHDINAPLSRLLEDSPPFKSAFNSVVRQIQQQISSFVSLNDFDVNKLKISIPHFGFKPGKADLTLFAAIGGIQGAELLLKRFTFNPDYSYSFEVFFVIYDDFGLGKDDRYSPSLYAAWNLQHRGEAKPFVNEIILQKTITGTLSVSEK